MSGPQIKVSINAAAPLARLEKIKELAEDHEATGAALAAALRRLTREHIAKKYEPRDDNGITFWSRVKQSIETEVEGSTVTISLNEIGVGIRYRGGDIRPGKSISSYTGKLTRALSIPTPAAPILQGSYERPARAGLLAFIRAVSRKDSTVGFLVEGQEKTITRGKNKGGKRIVPRPGGDLLYVLKTLVRIKPDPGIVPPEEAIRSTAHETLRDLLMD